MLTLADAGLCSADTLLTSLKSIWISSNGSRGGVGPAFPLRFGQNTPGFPQQLPDRSAGPGQANPRSLQGWIARQIVEQGSGTWRTSQMLWWRQTHLHDAGFDARVRAEVGRMMRSRTRAEEFLIEGIAFSQSLAPFFDPAHRASCRPGSFLWRGLRVYVQQITQQGAISHPFFFHGAFLLTKSTQPPFLLHCTPAAAPV
jgi:hypothetical protein